MQIILCKALKYIYIFSAWRKKKALWFKVIWVAVMLCYDADYNSLSCNVNDVHCQTKNLSKTSIWKFNQNYILREHVKRQQCLVNTDIKWGPGFGLEVFLQSTSSKDLAYSSRSRVGLRMALFPLPTTFPLCLSFVQQACKKTSD